MSVMGLVVVGTATPAGATTYQYEPPNNPPATAPYYGNYVGNQDVPACDTAPTSTACEQGEVYLLNDARAQINGMGPFQIPDDFFTMPLDKQLFILTNEDRVAYGEEPLQGISTTLDNDALAGANAGGDPADPGPTVNGQTVWSWGGTWAGGVGWLEDYVAWVYYDGYESGNDACTSPTAPGCWGHRDALLGQYGGNTNLAFGAAQGSGGADTIEAAMSGPIPYTYTWAQTQADIAAGTFPAAVAPGQPTNVQVSQPTDTCQFTVSWTPPATGTVGDYWIYVSDLSDNATRPDSYSYPQPQSQYATAFGYTGYYIDTHSTATSATLNFNDLSLGEPCNTQNPLQAAWVGVAAEAPGWDNGIPAGPVQAVAWTPLTFTDASPANGSVLATLPLCPADQSCSPVSISAGALQGGPEEGYAMQVVGGALPPGMTASTAPVPTDLKTPSGEPVDYVSMAIGGVPTQVGNYTFQVQGNDYVDPPITRSFSIKVTNYTPMAVSADSVPQGTPGTGYQGASASSWATTATGGALSAGCQAQVVSGSLPAGVSLGPATADPSNDSCTVGYSGTTNTTGTSGWTVQFTDGYGQTLDVPESVSVVAPAPLQMTTSTLPTVRYGSPYQATVAASGGEPPYTFQATGLPQGLEMSSTTGLISGTTYVASGSYPITLRVKDSAGNSVSRLLSIQVTGSPATVKSASSTTFVSANLSAGRSSIWVAVRGSAGTPTGSVRFSIDSSTRACALAPLGPGGGASCTVTLKGGSTHQVQATYGGSATYATSSATETVHVAQATSGGAGAAALRAGQGLRAGSHIQAGRYGLIMQKDGNLVEYAGGRALWASGTSGHTGDYLIMQSDGNAVIYGPGGRALWASGTSGHPKSELVLQSSDGNLVVYGPANKAWWANGA